MHKLFLSGVLCLSVVFVVKRFYRKIENDIQQKFIIEVDKEFKKQKEILLMAIIQNKNECSNEQEIERWERIIKALTELENTD